MLEVRGLEVGGEYLELTTTENHVMSRKVGITPSPLAQERPRHLLFILTI